MTCILLLLVNLIHFIFELLEMPVNPWCFSRYLLSISDLGSWTCIQSVDSLIYCTEECVHKIILILFIFFVGGAVSQYISMLNAAAQIQNKNIFDVFCCQFLNFSLRLFTFMHFTDAFIWRNIRCNEGVHFYQFMRVQYARNWIHNFGVESAMLYCLSFRKAV